MIHSVQKLWQYTMSNMIGRKCYIISLTQHIMFILSEYITWPVSHFSAPDVPLKSKGPHVVIWRIVFVRLNWYQSRTCAAVTKNRSQLETDWNHKSYPLLRHTSCHIDDMIYNHFNEKMVFTVNQTSKFNKVTCPSQQIYLHVCIHSYLDSLNKSRLFLLVVRTEYSQISG